MRASKRACVSESVFILVYCSVGARACAQSMCLENVERCTYVKHLFSFCAIITVGGEGSMGLGELSDPRLQQCTESKGVNGNGWGETKKIRKRNAGMGLKAKSQGP